MGSHHTDYPNTGRGGSVMHACLEGFLETCCLHWAWKMIEFLQMGRAFLAEDPVRAKAKAGRLGVHTWMRNGFGWGSTWGPYG